MITGIYILQFSNNSVYIGQSIDIERRYATHCNKLKTTSHCNSKLSAAYAKYGIPKLIILLECSEKELNDCEIEAICVYDSINKGLNIAPAAGSFPILSGETNGFSKYSDIDLIEAVKYLYHNLDQPLKVSAKVLGIHYSTIKNISNGTSHKWLAEKVPEEYNKLLSIKGKRAINSILNRGVTYKVMSPEGELHTVTHITEFSKKYGLNRGAFGQVLLGKTKHHKNWVLIPN